MPRIVIVLPMREAENRTAAILGLVAGFNLCKNIDACTTLFLRHPVYLFGSWFLARLESVFPWGSSMLIGRGQIPRSFYKDMTGMLLFIMNYLIECSRCCGVTTGFLVVAVALTTRVQHETCSADLLGGATD